LRPVIDARRPPKVAVLPRILLTTQQAAAALGMSASSLNTLTRTGVIPSLLLGSLRRYSSAALVRWAEEQSGLSGKAGAA